MKRFCLWCSIVATMFFAGATARAESVRYEYDPAGRLVGVQLADAGVGVGYRYDAAGNLLERNTCAGACIIAAACRASGDVNPANACERCDPGQSRTTWSPTAAGTSCDDGNGETEGDVCSASGQCIGKKKGCGCDLADSNGPSGVGAIVLFSLVGLLLLRRRGHLRRSVRIIALPIIAASAFAPRTAAAHAFDKTQVTLVRPGATGTFTVSDSTGCSANMSATSANTAIATISPSSGAGVSLTFTVTAVALGSSYITVTWSGIGQNCTDVGAGNVNVKVVATDTAANAPEEGNSGDPVSTATGELFFDEPAEFDLGGPMPLIFARYYASRLEQDGNSASALGRNWLHSFDWKLSNNGVAVTVTTARGQLITFVEGQSGYTLTSPAFPPYQLVTSGTDFVLGDPQGDRLYTFSYGGLLMKIEDGLGNTHALTYPTGKLSSVSDGLGRTLSFTYDGSNRLTAVSDGTRTVGFGYSSGNLATVTDAQGQTSTYEYTAAGGLSGMLARKVRPRGNAHWVQAYDDAGRVVTQTDALGNATTFAYDNTGAIVTDPMGGAERHVHAGRRLVGYTDALDAGIALAYDDAGRRAAATDRAGQTTNITRHEASGKVASMRLADGTTMTFTYQSRVASGITLWHLTQIQYADSTSETFTVTNGNITQMTDRGGGVWTFTHNARGQVLTMTTALGGIFTWTYNTDGTVATLRDPAENTTTYAYDALRRVTGVTNADATTRAYAYDAVDRLTSLRDERNQTAAFAYDTNGNLVTRVDPLDASTTFAYDAMDRLASVADPLGYAAARSYDALGRPAAIIDRAGLGTALGYNARGFLATLRGPAPAVDGGVDGGALTQFGRGPEGELVAVTDPLGAATTFSSDGVGRRTGATSPSDAGFRLAYDSMSRLTVITEPDGGATWLGYDSRGYLTSVRLPSDAGTALARNAQGGVTSMTDPNGAAWLRAFDPSGRPTSDTDPLGRATTFAYDARNRMSVATFPSSMGTLTYTYDGIGSVTRKLYSDATDLAFTHDAVGRLSTASGVSIGYDARGGITSTNGIAVTRDAAGRIATMTLAPSKTVAYTYDNRNLVSTVTDWVGGATAFSYDAARRLTSLARPNGVVTTYAYDSDGRVASIVETGDGGAVLSSIALTRDSLGRIVAAERNTPLAASPQTGSATWSYDVASQLDGGAQDALGRVTAVGEQSVTWDLASRLKTVGDGGAAVTYAHDAFGRRTARTAGGVTESYVWNDALAGGAVSIVGDGGADVRYAVRAPSGLLLHTVEATDNARRYFHFDEMGHTLFRTDESGSVTDRYAYGPYGEPWGENANGPGTPFTFSGASSVIRDSASGHYAMGLRVYDPTTARFLTRDPAPRSSSPNEANPYTYARQNPLLYIDPRGTNARVNQGGVHTDISVDVWEGDVIVGVLTVSFAAKGYTGKFGDIGEAFSTVIGGTQGQFSVSFRAGQSIGTANTNNQTTVPGSRAQDQRMADGMLRAIGEYTSANAGQLPIQLIRNMQRTQGKGAKLSVSFVRDSAGDWSTYRAVTTSCNAFTDAMLDIYFGENWGGLFFEGDGLVGELKGYLDDGYKRAQERQRREQQAWNEAHLVPMASTGDGHLVVFYLMR
jgi:RHS repeat-associated protein